MKKHILKTVSLITVSILFFYGVVNGQESSDSDAAELARASQKPLAKMISVPFQNNTTFGIDPHGRSQNVLNIQPVYPIGLGKLNMINRLIAPIITQPSTIEDNSTSGLGDLSLTSWFSPANSGIITWGLGPVFQLPTATSDNLGTGEFGIGPSVVALAMIEKWVAGVVINNVWTFGDAEENKFLFQYFINYNMPKATYLVSAPIITANWNAPEGEQWIVPVGGGGGKIVKFGKLPVNINAQVYYNAVRPTGWGAWQSRFQVQFMFPK